MITRDIDASIYYKRVVLLGQPPCQLSVDVRGANAGLRRSLSRSPPPFLPARERSAASRGYLWFVFYPHCKFRASFRWSWAPCMRIRSKEGSAPTLSCKTVLLRHDENGVSKNVIYVYNACPERVLYRTFLESGLRMGFISTRFVSARSEYSCKN